MASDLELSDTMRNTRLDGIDTAIGTTGRLRILTGTQPTLLATADSGTLLVDITLHNPAFGAAAAGVMAKDGVWSGTGGATPGTAGYFRIYASDNTTCIMQGTVGLSGASPDLVLDNTSISTGQTVTISTFTLTDGNDEDL